MDELTLIYLGLTSLMGLLIMLNSSAFGPVGIIMIFLALIAIMMIFVINYADYIVFPLITIITGTKIIPAKGYYIPKSSNAVIKYINGIYYATGYLTANVYNYVFTSEGVDQSEDMKLGAAPDKWERIVMNAGFPFRFNIIAIAGDVQRYRDALEGDRGAIEYRLSKEMSSSRPSNLSIQDMQRQMNILDARINRLSGGERPIDSIMYIDSTSVGVSEKEAMDNLTNQLNHLQTLFNSFDLSITRVVGRELYHLFGFNYSISDPSVLTSIFSGQK